MWLACSINALQVEVMTCLVIVYLYFLLLLFDTIYLEVHQTNQPTFELYLCKSLPPPPLLAADGAVNAVTASAAKADR